MTSIFSLLDFRNILVATAYNFHSISIKIYVINPLFVACYRLRSACRDMTGQGANGRLTTDRRREGQTKGGTDRRTEDRQPCSDQFTTSLEKLCSSTFCKYHKELIKTWKVC